MIEARAPEPAWHALLGAVEPRCARCGAPGEWRSPKAGALCTGCAAGVRGPLDELGHRAAVAAVEDGLLEAVGF